MFTDNTKFLTILSIFLLCGLIDQDAQAQCSSRWNTQKNQPPPSEVVVARWTFGHNNDLANFWDWYDQPRMPLGPATDAFRLGVNYMVYALTP
jgi:hypothetical protein